MCSVNRWLTHPLRVNFYSSGWVSYFHGFHTFMSFMLCQPEEDANLYFLATWRTYLAVFQYEYHLLQQFCFAKRNGGLLG